MKLFKLLTVALILSSLESCIKKEPLNAECDIISATMPGDILNRQPVIQNDKVTFIVKNGVSVTDLAPEFELTPGATIYPPSGSSHNFIIPQHYVVFSEDGHWEKVYTVEVQTGNNINLDFDFEHVRINNGYDVFYELDRDGNEILTWASGNAGFKLTGMASSPDGFPTFQTDNGRSGKCAALVTRSTGGFGAMAKKPLAAGNLFIGKFNIGTALSKPLESTQFGTPFMNVPRYLTGYYQYTPGETYCEADGGKLVPVPGKIDKFNIYAVFFEATPDMEMLDGTNALSPDNENIIAVAEISDAQRVATKTWTEFNIPFVYRDGKEIDLKKLSEGKYSITIVCSSSIDGDYFSGAIGSTLLVDEVSLVCLSQDELKPQQSQE